MTTMLHAYLVGALLTLALVLLIPTKNKYHLRTYIFLAVIWPFTLLRLLQLIFRDPPEKS